MKKGQQNVYQAVSHDRLYRGSARRSLVDLCSQVLDASSIPLASSAFCVIRELHRLNPLSCHGNSRAGLWMHMSCLLFSFFPCPSPLLHCVPLPTSTGVNSTYRENRGEECMSYGVGTSSYTIEKDITYLGHKLVSKSLKV
jgi:hypothetical protein